MKNLLYLRQYRQAAHRYMPLLFLQDTRKREHPKDSVTPFLHQIPFDGDSDLNMYVRNSLYIETRNKNSSVHLL